MFYVYKLINTLNQKYYYGYTNNVKLRLNNHRYFTNSGRKSKLYSSMRKHGFDKFSCEVVFESPDRDLALAKEVELICLSDPNCLNLAEGGEGGYVVPKSEKEAWRNKLKDKRVGRKPALGMKHSEENKLVFGTYGKLRWDIYGRYPADIVNHSFKQANEKFGISKTHYYRLLKQAKINELG